MEKNPNGESGVNGGLAADDKRGVVIGMVSSLHRIDTLTPQLHEI